MAAKTVYTEDFKRKVIEEYRKSDQTLEEVSKKYELPPALLQDWINKEKLNDYFISISDRPEEKKDYFASVKAHGAFAYQKLRANGWLLSALMPMLVSLATFVTCNKNVVESEFNENNQDIHVRLDSLIDKVDALNVSVGEVGLTLEKIDNELELKISPSITIHNDNRRWSKTKRKNIINRSVEVNNSIVEPTKDSIGIAVDSCCCQCGKDTIR